MTRIVIVCTAAAVLVAGSSCKGAKKPLQQSAPSATPAAEKKPASGNETVTITGEAGNAKLGAVVLVNSSPTYVAGLDAWPDDVVGKTVKVTGTLRTTDAFEAKQDENGAISQGTKGPVTFIDATGWDVVGTDRWGVHGIHVDEGEIAARNLISMTIVHGSAAHHQLAKHYADQLVAAGWDQVGLVSEDSRTVFTLSRGDMRIDLYAVPGATGGSSVSLALGMSWGDLEGVFEGGTMVDDNPLDHQASFDKGADAQKLHERAGTVLLGKGWTKDRDEGYGDLPDGIAKAYFSFYLKDHRELKLQTQARSDGTVQLFVWVTWIDPDAPPGIDRTGNVP